MSSFQRAREALGLRLRELRRDAHLTGRQLAELQGWHPSKVSKVEGGKQTPSEADIEAWSVACARPELAPELVASLRSLEGQYLEFRRMFRVGQRAAQEELAEIEAATDLTRNFESVFVQGLLQTPEYAKVVTEVSAIDEEKVDSVVRVRMRRQSELAKRSSQPRQHFIIDEGVIRRHIGIKRDPEMMPAQLRRVADRAERDELITVGVVPFEAGAYPGLFGPFTLLEFEGGLPDILYLDAGRGDFTIASGDDPRISEYAADFERLLEDALPAQESIQLIRSAAAEMSKQTS